jgi:flagellar export protein FliJ
MNTVRGKPGYTLEPLMKQCGWEIDALRAELSLLTSMLAQEEGRAAQIAARIRQAQQDMREMQRAPVIAPDRKELADRYLRHQDQLLSERSAEVSRLRGLRDQAQRQLNGKRQAMKALERHKEKKLTERRVEEIRRELAEADRNWLSTSDRTGVL